MIAYLGWFWLQIHIYGEKKKKLVYSVLLFLSPLECVAILGNGAKVAAAIYSRGRCMDPGAHSWPWAWGFLPQGDIKHAVGGGVLCVWFFFLWLFHFISIAGLILNQI